MSGSGGVVSTTGFLNEPRPETPGTLISHPVTNGSVTLGRTTTINYVNGWLLVGGEGPGSAEPFDLIKRVYDISNPAAPVRRHPSDFGLTYPGNFWIQNNDGWNAHGSAQSGPYLLPMVMRVQNFGGPVELGGQDGIPNLGEMALGYNRSSQAGPWEATMLWYGTPNQTMEIRRVSVGPGGAAVFHSLATFDHVGAFGGGDWHPMFFGDLLIYARSGGAARDGVVAYRLEYHDPNNDGVLDSVTPHFVSSLPGGFEGYWPNLFSDGTGLYVIGSATDILTSADITAAASPAGGAITAGPTLTIPRFSNASYPVYQDQFGFIHNRKINMTQFLAGQGTNSIVLTLNEAATGVDTSQISLPLGNLWITGGYPNPGLSQGMGVWVHQQGPDTNAPTVTYHLPQANRASYPRHAPLSFLLHEHPKNGGLRNGVDFTVRPVSGDGVALGAFVPGYLIHDFSGVLTFTPNLGLAANTTYQVDFLSDVSDPLNPVGFVDAAGNRMAPYSFRFSTGGGVNAPAAPQVTAFTATDFHPLPGEAFSVSMTAIGTGALEYRFNFDGLWSDWGAHSVTNHAYNAAGRHRVLGQVRDETGIVVTEPLNILAIVPPAGPRPTQSSTVAVGDDGANGRRAWVVDPDADTVTVINPANGSVVAEHPVGKNPRSIARDAQGRYWVTCHGSDELRVLNANGSTAHTLALPYGSAPFGVAASPDGQFLYVSLYGSGRLRRYTAATPAGVPLEAATFPTPRALAVSGDGQRVLVTRFISPELEAEVGEYSGTTLGAVRTFRLASANTTDNGDRAAGVPNYLSGIAISPDGTRAAIVSKQDNVLRGTLFGVGNHTHETTVRAVLSILDLQANAEVRHARRDFDNSDSPTAVEYTPLGDTLLVTLQGNNRVVGVDALNLQPLTAILVNGSTLTSPAVKTLEAATGLAPQGLVIDAAGERVLVQNFMGRSVTVIDGHPLLAENRTSLPVIATALTTGTELLSPGVLRGKRIFYNAADTRMSADGYISCASCHVDGGTDGRVWDFTGRGEGLRRTSDLRGRAGTGHGNVHWTGNFDEIQDFEHDIRSAFGGSGFLTNSPTEFATVHPSPATTKAGLSTDLDALAAYVSSLNHTTIPRSPIRAADGSLTAEALEGRDTFVLMNCQQCHAGAALTDSVTAPIGATLLHAVGTASQLSGQRLSQPLTGIDTPTLRGLHATRSYLHHGQAATLAEVFEYAGGVLMNAAQGQFIGAPQVYAEGDTPAEGGGGILRGAWGGALVNVGGAPGSGVRFINVDGGPGGNARIGIRHILRGVSTSVLRVNGVEQPIQLLTQSPNNDWMTSGWRWVTADITLGPGATNVIEVLRGTHEFTDFQLNAILVSHAGVLEQAEPHRSVLSLSGEARTNLFTFLRSLDGAPISGLTTNMVPVAETDVVVRLAGRSLKIPLYELLANDSDLDGPQPLSVTAVGPVSANGVVLSMQNGFVLYDAGTNNTNDSFAYTLGDGDSSVQGTVLIQVENEPGGLTLNVTGTATSGAERHFSIAGIPGRRYALQQAATISGPWSGVTGDTATGQAGANGSLLLRDISPPSDPTTFYRVVEVISP
jgi:YVTN family beta-propeller protein